MTTDTKKPQAGKGDAKPAPGAEYKDTVFLPKTDFPMKAGLPQREPLLLARWEKLGIWKRLRAQSKGREKFILHDGPPFSNGHIHMGTSMNKCLKDFIQYAYLQMLNLMEMAIILFALRLGLINLLRKVQFQCSMIF